VYTTQSDHEIIGLLRYPNEFSLTVENMFISGCRELTIINKKKNFLNKLKIALHEFNGLGTKVSSLCLSTIL
jgi:hypothetical protein